ncbi:MAG TPA: thiamine phosphate synthase [Dehalococcoidia bacterium]|jgi:thiamine-phosphate pyrophosphorylase
MTKPGLALPALMLVTDRGLAGGEDALVRKVRESVEGGVSVVQLREKDLNDETLLRLAERIKAAIDGRALFIVNGSLDVALAIGADGIHLPEAMPALRKRAKGLIVGRSVHSAEAAKLAEQSGADYAVFGPVYETRRHAGVPATGLGELSDVVKAVSIPVVAIGGVLITRVAAIMDANAAGVAVISAILGSPSPHEAASAIRRELQTYEHHFERQASRT